MKIKHQQVPQELWVVLRDHIIVMASRDVGRPEQYMAENPGCLLALYRLRDVTDEVIVEEAK